MDNQTKAYIFALLSVLFWSTVATAFKLSLQHISYYELLLYSSLTSSIFLFFILLIQKKINLITKLSIKEWLYSLLLGFLNPFLYYLILFKAYDILPTQEALTLNYTWAIMVVIFSIPMLKQKISFISLGAIIISFIGVIIIATKGDIFSLKFSNTLGVILALSSSIIWALYWILNIKDNRDVIVKLFLNFSIGFVCILILMLSTEGLKSPSFYGIIGSVYVGLFEMGITFILWLNALKYSKTTALVSNLIYLSPFASLFLINIVLGESIMFSTVIGLILIIGGIFIQRSTAKK